MLPVTIEKRETYKITDVSQIKDLHYAACMLCSFTFIFCSLFTLHAHLFVFFLFGVLHFFISCLFPLSSLHTAVSKNYDELFALMRRAVKKSQRCY